MTRRRRAVPLAPPVTRRRWVRSRPQHRSGVDPSASRSALDQRSWTDDWSDSASDAIDDLDPDLDADLDFAGFDAMGGFGVEPWADELFGPDEDDED